MGPLGLRGREIEREKERKRDREEDGGWAPSSGVLSFTPSLQQVALAINCGWGSLKRSRLGFP